MKAYLLENGNLLVPRRAESKDGDVIGDAMVEVEPGTPLYEEYKDEAEPYDPSRF